MTKLVHIWRSFLNWCLCVQMMFFWNWFSFPRHKIGAYWMGEGANNAFRRFLRRFIWFLHKTCRNTRFYSAGFTRLCVQPRHRKVSHIMISRMIRFFWLKKFAPYSKKYTNQAHFFDPCIFPRFRAPRVIPRIPRVLTWENARQGLVHGRAQDVF